MSRKFSYLVFAVTALFFLLFFLVPIWTTVKEAFQTSDGKFTIAYVIEVFKNPVYLEGLINSLKMGIFSTLLSLLIALPLALITNTYRFPGKEILNSLLLVPMILPPFVGALAVSHLRQGVIEILP